MNFRLVDAGWDTVLTDAVEKEFQWPACHFIVKKTIERFLAQSTHGALQVITRFGLDDFALGVSDLSALSTVGQLGCVTIRSETTQRGTRITGLEGQVATLRPRASRRVRRRNAGERNLACPWCLRKGYSNLGCSVPTTPEGPYQDAFGSDGLLTYRSSTGENFL